MTSLLLVGCGNMGGAMLAGWRADLPDAIVTVIDPAPVRAPGVQVLTSVTAYQGTPDAVVLAVKPQMLRTVAPGLEPMIADGTLLVSVLAAVEIATLRAAFPRGDAIVRAVPNLPASIGSGVTALAADGIDPAARALATSLFAPLGPVEWLGESAIDAATSVAGCGPAFLFRFADAVVRAGVAQGLDEGQARRLFAATMVGSGKMLMASEESAASMARRVASPGGVTLAGLAVLDADDALVRLVAATLAAAARRSAEMAVETRP